VTLFLHTAKTRQKLLLTETLSISFAKLTKIYVFSQSVSKTFSHNIFDLTQRLSQCIFFLHEVQHRSAEVKSSLFKSSMGGNDAVGLIIRKKTTFIDHNFRLLMNDPRYNFFQTPKTNFFPNINKINLPFSILILQTNTLNFLPNLLLIKIQQPPLLLHNNIQLSLHPSLKKCKQVVQSIFLSNDNTPYPLVKIL
jgi:hypothetical protein